MVKSKEQQIVFLNRDMLPLYGISSLEDTNTVVSMERLDKITGFLDEVNRLLPFVALFYPIKKFNLHKTDHRIKTIKQSFNLLRHCLEMSSVPHTIWTKKQSRRNMYFLQLSEENCVHKQSSIVHIITKTMTQTLNQQMYDMSKVCPPETNGSSPYFVGDPQVTLFKSLYKRATQYVKFPVELQEENGKFTLSHDKYSTINAIKDLILVVNVGKQSSINDAFSSINQITIKIGDVILLDVDGSTLLRILKLYPAQYTQSMDGLANGKLIVPLQYLLTQTRPIVLCCYDEDVTITYTQKTRDLYKVECWCYGFKMTPTEYDRIRALPSEILMWQYLSVMRSDCDEILLNYPICISEVMITPKDTRQYKMLLDDVPLLDSKNPLIMCDKSVIVDDNTYYSLTQFNNTTNVLYGPFAGFVAGTSTKKITITPKCDSLNMTLRFKALMYVNNHKHILGYSLTKMCPSDKFYPLTQLSDHEYVEGYWWSKDLFVEHKDLPFPKATNTPVDPLFLEKLQKITKTCPHEEFFGFSSCRICSCHNGSVEYTVINDKGISFRFPDGLLHYYTKHNVQPSKEFYECIMSLQTSGVAVPRTIGTPLNGLDELSGVEGVEYEEGIENPLEDY
jgi:hypothetical protein